jgi:hypothetical protein
VCRLDRRRGSVAFRREPLVSHNCHGPASINRHGPACPGHQVRDGAVSDGPDEPGRDVDEPGRDVDAPGRDGSILNV